MQFSLMLQPKPNITYKSWLKVTFQGAHAVSGTPDPPFGSYFFHGLSERPLELIVLFEVRMKQTVMIENHFLSGKIISISLQCHPFPPHPSSLNTDPAPPLTISETSPAHFIVGFSRVFFFLDANPGCQTRFHRPAGLRCVRQEPEDLQKRVRHCKKGKLHVSLPKPSLSREYYCLVEFLNKPVSTTKQTNLS